MTGFPPGQQLLAYNQKLTAEDFIHNISRAFMNITVVMNVHDISGAKDTHVHSTPPQHNCCLCGIYTTNSTFFLTINEAALMLCATMNEIKHCASKSNYAFGIKLKWG